MVVGIAGAAALIVAFAGLGGLVRADPSSTVIAPATGSPARPVNTPFKDTSEPVGIEAGTYRMPSSSSSVADFTVTFPEGWTVQHGDIFIRHPDTAEAVGFYATLVDSIYADACEGSDGELMKVGPSVDDLATALLRQPGPQASGPVVTRLGHYPATRIDLTIPKGFSLKNCSLRDALQIWLSPSTDYTVLPTGSIAGVYIVDVDGQRQVFVTQQGSATSGKDVRELQAVLKSIHVET